MARKCPVCGTQWQPDPYTVRRAPYCSRLCELSAVLPAGPGSVRMDLRSASRFIDPAVDRRHS